MTKDIASAGISKEWDACLRKYHTHIKFERRMSGNTVESYMRDAMRFGRYAHEKYGAEPLVVESHMIDDFMNELYREGAEKSTQGRTLSGINSFYGYLVSTGALERSPSEYAVHPKAEHYLPDTLSVEEIDKILNEIDLSSEQGFRNRTILETLYSCGMRVSELISLRLPDIFFDEGVVRVTGKGNKQRLIPLSSECKRLLETYLTEYRSLPADATSSEYVFLNRRGRKLTRNMIFYIVKDAAAAAGITKEISPHTFRHSFATHLLHGGANIRQVQELLGHESISTTEIYTHLDIEHLRKTVTDYHPLGKDSGHTKLSEKS